MSESENLKRLQELSKPTSGIRTFANAEFAIEDRILNSENKENQIRFVSIPNVMREQLLRLQANTVQAMIMTLPEEKVQLITPSDIYSDEEQTVYLIDPSVRSLQQFAFDFSGTGAATDLVKLAINRPEFDSELEQAIRLRFGINKNREEPVYTILS